MIPLNAKKSEMGEGEIQGWDETSEVVGKWWEFGVETRRNRTGVRN
jgi:hypothetical protein